MQRNQTTDVHRLIMCNNMKWKRTNEKNENMRKRWWKKSIDTQSCLLGDWKDIEVQEPFLVLCGTTFGIGCRILGDYSVVRWTKILFLWYHNKHVERTNSTAHNPKITTGLENPAVAVLVIWYRHTSYNCRRDKCKNIQRHYKFSRMLKKRERKKENSWFPIPRIERIQ